MGSKYYTEYDSYIKEVSEKHSQLCTAEKYAWGKFDKLIAGFDLENKLDTIEKMADRQVPTDFLIICSVCLSFIHIIEDR